MRALFAIALACSVGLACAASDSPAEGKPSAHPQAKTAQSTANSKLDTAALEKAIRESIKEASERESPNEPKHLGNEGKIANETANLAVETKALSGYTLYLGIATAALAFIALGQLWMFWSQLCLMKAGADDAKALAKAAQSNADSAKDMAVATKLAQRAYLGVSRAFFRVESRQLVAEIEIKNAGLTPAKHCTLTWHYHIENAPTLERGVDEDTAQGVLVPGFLWNQHLDLPIRVTTFTAIENGSSIPVMWGRVDYTDSFNERRWTTFCFSAGRQLKEGWDVQAVTVDEHRNDAD